MNADSLRGMGLPELFERLAARIADSWLKPGKTGPVAGTPPAAGSEGGAQFATYIASASARYGVPEELVRAVIQQESNFNPRAVSSAGAKGLMQLMDGTAHALGVKDSFDPRQNIEGGVRYLHDQLEHFGGDVAKALAAYNAGPGAVERYGGVPPYAETQAYVRKIMARCGRDWEA